ncbi:MAG: ATP-binding protein [Sandaracinaceae bacterium]
MGGHSDSDDARLLAFARRLQAFQTFDELIDELCNEVRAAVGYSTAWLAIFDESGERVRIMAIQGDMAERVWERAAVIPVSGDPYMERIRDDRTVQIVEDAQVADDVNRDIVTALGNRTIVNVPLTLIDRPFGAIGTGTFGDEGVRVPSRADLAYLEAMGQQLVMASARILLDQQRKEAAAEREALMRQLEQRQRLESLGRLAGGVAHEFNNLLTVVHGSASLLLLEEDDPEKVEELRVIIDAAERSEQLTRKLLAMGKRQPLRLEVTGLDAIVRDAQALMRPVVPKGVELECSVEEGMRVRVDAAQVEQLLLNLVLNACDAMPEGGRVTVRGDAVELDERFAEEHVWARPGLYAQVVVEDTGVGMEPELLARIFEPFFTTKPEEKGSGLGLAISRGVAEQHGGFLHATSVPGEGSRFALYLPRSTQ